MPDYPFITCDAAGVEKDDAATVFLPFAMADAPSIGSVIEHDGLRLRRLPTAPAIDDHWKPYISSRLPRHLDVPGVKHTPSGKPIIETQQQEREAAAALGWTRD